MGFTLDINVLNFTPYTFSEIPPKYNLARRKRPSVSHCQKYLKMVTLNELYLISCMVSGNYPFEFFKHLKLGGSLNDSIWKFTINSRCARRKSTQKVHFVVELNYEIWQFNIPLNGTFCMQEEMRINC